jgi:hypothetical protein
MPSLHALYDPLVSINVPTQKALAVVESMERDMLAQLATRSDVEHAQLLMRADFDAFRKEIRGEMDGLRKELKSEIDGLRKEVKVEIDGLRKEFKADLALLQSTMTVRLGSMLMVGFSLMFAALKLT